VGGLLQRGAATVFSPLVNSQDWWSTWRNQAAQIAQLRATSEELTQQVRESASDRARADALDELLRVSAVGRYRVVPAEVIAVGPAQDFSWSVTIDAGSLDGVEREMTVINGEGLVGRVVKVNPTSATVVLLVDASSAVGGRVASTEEIGIVSGAGRQDSLDFQLLDPLAELVLGDSLVTFGSRDGRPYAPGIPIGEVVDIAGSAGQLTRVATVRPFVDVSQLSVVGVVVRPPRKDPRDSVLPPKPDDVAVEDESGVGEKPGPEAGGLADAPAVIDDGATTERQ
jgi:rod shape-determining protein MreC